MRGGSRTACRSTGRYAYRRKGARRTKTCSRPQIWSAGMFFLNDPSTMTGILPMACGGVDELTRSLPAEFSFSVDSDEVIQPCSQE